MATGHFLSFVCKMIIGWYGRFKVFSEGRLQQEAKEHGLKNPIASAEGASRKKLQIIYILVCAVFMEKSNIKNCIQFPHWWHFCGKGRRPDLGSGDVAVLVRRCPLKVRATAYWGSRSSRKFCKSAAPEMHLRCIWDWIITTEEFWQNFKDFKCNIGLTYAERIKTGTDEPVTNWYLGLTCTRSKSQTVVSFSLGRAALPQLRSKVPFSIIQKRHLAAYGRLAWRATLSIKRGAIRL